MKYAHVAPRRRYLAAGAPASSRAARAVLVAPDSTACASSASSATTARAGRTASPGQCVPGLDHALYSLVVLADHVFVSATSSSQGVYLCVLFLFSFCGVCLSVWVSFRCSVVCLFECMCVCIHVYLCCYFIAYSLSFPCLCAPYIYNYIRRYVHIYIL